MLSNARHGRRAPASGDVNIQIGDLSKQTT